MKVFLCETWQNDQYLKKKWEFSGINGARQKNISNYIQEFDIDYILNSLKGITTGNSLDKR